MAVDIISIISVIFLWVLAAVIVILIGYFVWIERQFKYLATVQIAETEGVNKGYIKSELTVKARFLRRTNKLLLRKYKQKIDMPPSDAWKPSGRTWKVYLQHDGNRMFAPSVPRYNSPLTFTPAQYQIMNSMVDEGIHEIRRHEKSSFWNENKAIIVVLFAMAIAVLIIVISLEQAGKTAADILAAANANRDALINAGKQTITPAVIP